MSSFLLFKHNQFNGTTITKISVTLRGKQAHTAASKYHQGSNAAFTPLWSLVLTRQKLIPFDQDGGKLISSLVRSHLTEENEHSNRVSFRTVT